MALVVRPDEHLGLVSFPEAIDAVEQAFLAWGRQPELNLPRQIVDGSIRLAVHPAATPFFSTSGLMVHSRQPRVGSNRTCALVAQRAREQGLGVEV